MDVGDAAGGEKWQTDRTGGSIQSTAGCSGLLALARTGCAAGPGLQSDCRIQSGWQFREWAEVSLRPLLWFVQSANCSRLEPERQRRNFRLTLGQWRYRGAWRLWPPLRTPERCGFGACTAAGYRTDPAGAMLWRENGRQLPGLF